MQFFVDIADVEQISELAAISLVDGVTSSPPLVVNAAPSIKEAIRDICGVVEGPLS